MQTNVSLALGHPAFSYGPLPSRCWFLPPACVEKQLQCDIKNHPKPGHLLNSKGKGTPLSLRIQHRCSACFVQPAFTKHQVTPLHISGPSRGVLSLQFSPAAVGIKATEWLRIRVQSWDRQRTAWSNFTSACLLPLKHSHQSSTNTGTWQWHSQESSELWARTRTCHPSTETKENREKMLIFLQTCISWTLSPLLLGSPREAMVFCFGNCSCGKATQK